MWNKYLNILCVAVGFGVKTSQVNGFTISTVFHPSSEWYRNHHAPNTQRFQFHKGALSMANSEQTSFLSSSKPVRVTVMGGGNFGLAISNVLARKDIPVTLLVRSEEDADSINNHHIHPRKMTDITMPLSLRATTDPAEAFVDATYIVHAVPVQFSRSFLMNVKEHIPEAVPILSVSKGIETSSLGFMVDVLKECLGPEDQRGLAFLSGPSFAREVCEGKATAVVIASEDHLLTSDLADLMSDSNFRVFTSRDVIGLEIGGAVKNVIAVAAGMCEGLGLGTNAKSGLVTRGYAEMQRLGLALGAKSSTISGLSGE